MAQTQGNDQTGYNESMTTALEQRSQPSMIFDGSQERMDTFGMIDYTQKKEHSSKHKRRARGDTQIKIKPSNKDFFTQPDYNLPKQV